MDIMEGFEWYARQDSNLRSSAPEAEHFLAILDIISNIYREHNFHSPHYSPHKKQVSTDEK